MIAAAAIPPTSCAMKSKPPRSGEITLATTSASEMAGLNNAPETRKNIQTLIINDKPKDKEMNIKFEVDTKA